MPNSIYGEYEKYISSLVIRLELRLAIYGHLFLEKTELKELKNHLENIYNFHTTDMSETYGIVVGMLKSMGWNNGNILMNDASSIDFIRRLKFFNVAQPDIANERKQKLTTIKGILRSIIMIEKSEYQLHFKSRVLYPAIAISQSMKEYDLKGMDLMLEELLAVDKRPFSLKYARTIHLKEKHPVRMIISHIDAILEE